MCWLPTLVAAQLTQLIGPTVRIYCRTSLSAQRDLSEYEIAYLFIDGIAERLRPGGKRKPVLAAWGFTAEAAGSCCI